MAIPPVNAKKDGNRIASLLAVSTIDGVTPIPLEANPLTGALIIEGSLAVGAAKSNTPTATTASITTASTAVLGANANRLGAMIFNEGAATAYLSYGTTASLTAYSTQLVSGAYYELPFAFIGALSAITAAGTATLRITELT